MRNIYDSHRIGGGRDEHGAGGELAQRLAGSEHGQRTFQPAQVEDDGFGIGTHRLVQARGNFAQPRAGRRKLEPVSQPARFEGQPGEMASDLTCETTSLGFARLFPLAEARAALDAQCAEIAAVRLPVAAACGLVAAATVVASSPVPDRALALRDGWAVVAQETLGASSYAPVFLVAPPLRVRSGDPMPEATDAVLPLPFVDARAMPVEIYGSVAPFDGVRRRGGDVPAGLVLLEAGALVGPDQVALLALAGLTEIAVRVPSVLILASGCAEGQGAAAAYVAAAAEREGARSRVETLAAMDAAALARVVAAADADLMLVLGDSDCGGTLVRALAAAGEVCAHGIAVRPGDSMGCGRIARGAGQASIPVVFAGPRIEGLLAAWLLLARPCLDRICGRKPREPAAGGVLSRKIVSAPGMSDLALLRRAIGVDREEMWEPVATGDIPWSAILGAEAWLLIEPESEGLPGGRKICPQRL